jgi:uncharacterized membrane protein
MNIINFNESWMIYNIALAGIAVGTGWLLYVIPKKLPLVFILSAIWLLFAPNTAYVITDIRHLFRQWSMVANPVFRIIILGQYMLYIIIGLFSFLAAMYPVERILAMSRSKRRKKIKTALLIILNFFIGFGIVLGRIERINSWWIVTQTQRVFAGIHTVISSPQQMLLVVLLGLFANLFYFLFRKPVMYAFFRKPDRQKYA